MKQSLDIFQMKGLRKILGVTTTFIDRQNKTTKLYNDMQKEIHDNTPIGKAEKILKPYFEVYEDRKNRLLAKIIRQPPTDPIRYCTFKFNTFQPIQIEDRAGTIRRVGQPRVRWVESSLERLWRIIGQNNETLRYEILNLERPSHTQAIEEAARLDMSEERPSRITKRE